MEVAIVSDTSGLLWFHTFPALEPLLRDKKKKINFFLTEKKKKMQRLQYKDREKPTIK